MPRLAIKRKKREAATVRVGPNSEWTDYLGFQELFGIRRSLAYHLAQIGAIKSISLRESGEKRGKRLFHVPSARQYLNARLQAAESE
jgi:hypothetical protein